jgi:DNA primase
VQETQGIDFADALEVLARRAGITLVRDAADARQRGRRGAAVEALKKAIDVYHDRLKKSSEAGPVRAYLRQRGYDVGIIDEWKLGFAATDWDTLTKELRAGGLDDRVLIDAGLSRRGRHGLFDVFRGRLMFPIHDLRGDAVGFGGRKIDEIDRNATNNPDAKYVNSADSAVYHKAQVLFGLDRARREISEDHPAVIVEGYTDVIAMHQAGVKTAVATCGTALGDGHFDLLRRFSDRIVLAFDSDEAGARAALRGDELEAPFRLDIDLRVAAMPDGLDPADLVQQARTDELVLAVQKARPLLERRIEHEMSLHDLSTPEGRARALEGGAAHLAKVHDRNVLDDYARQLAFHVQVSPEVVHQAVKGKDVSREFYPDPDRPLDRVEAAALRTVLDDPVRIDQLMVDDFSDERLRHAFASIQSLDRSGHLDLSGVADPVARSLLTRLAVDNTPVAPPDEVLGRVRERRLDREIALLQRELASMDEQSQARSDLPRRLIALQQEKRSSTRM